MAFTGVLRASLRSSRAAASACRSSTGSRILAAGYRCSARATGLHVGPPKPGGPRAPLLRDYQERDVALIRSHADSGKNPLYVLPTGGGKTMVVAELVRQWEAEGKRSIVVVHRREILLQMADALDAAGVRPRIVAADESKESPSVGNEGEEGPQKTTLAMIQTLARRAGTSERDALRSADFVLVDEAHHAVSDSYKATLADSCGEATRFVGVTATPFRLDGTGLKEFGFDKMLRGPNISDLIKSGFLVKPRLEVANLIDTEGIDVKRGDYIVKDLSRAARVATDEIVKMFVNEARMERDSSSGEPLVRSTIFFAVDVDHSIELRDALAKAGVPSEHVDGTTPKSDRDAILERFRAGEVRALTNCEIATEGFDAPSCSAVVLARPTKSRALFMQMIGRGLRAAPGKDDCLFFDCSGLVAEHGSPTANFNFSLESGFIPDKDDSKQRVDIFRERVASHLAERMQSLHSFRYVQLELTLLGGNTYEIAGADRNFDFAGFTFQTMHTFSSDVFGLLVGNNKAPEDDAAIFDTVFVEDRIAYLRRNDRINFLQDLVHFIADPTEENVRTHYKRLLRIAQEKGFKPGWAYYRLRDRWGQELAKRVTRSKSSKPSNAPDVVPPPSFDVITLPTKWR